MTSDISFLQLTAQYPDEASAVSYFTAKRWPNGIACIGCQSRSVYDCKSKRHLPLYKCPDCRKQFTVTSGTVMNNTHLPLRAWLFAFHIIGGAKKGISARQLARHLGITVKSAWHLAHRIRATMTDNAQKFSGIVETDEAYIGGKRKFHGKGYRGNKVAVQTIIKRGKRTTRADGNQARSTYSQAQTIVLNPTDHVDGRTVGAKLRTHTEPGKTVLMTDDSPIYTKTGEGFVDHHTVNHKKKEYFRQADDGHLAHTNTAEGYFGNFKRQIDGTHHHVSKKHAQRYAEEHDHKYNNRGKSDTEIAENAIAKLGTTKPLTLYKSASGQGESLIETKQGERRKHGTMRGMSDHVRTGKKRESTSVSSPAITELAGIRSKE